MPYPRQRNTPAGEQSATAPYNFVRLPDPEELWTVSLKTEPIRHDVYDAEALTGRIECDLETLTLVFIRSGLSPRDFAKLEADRDTENATDFRKLTRNRPDFFHVGEGKDANIMIPGSSLRGMLRNLVKIAGFGNLATADQPPPYRAFLEKKSLADDYARLFLPGRIEAKFLPKAGFLVYANGKWSIAPALETVGQFPTTNGYYRIEADLADDAAAKSPQWHGFRHASKIDFQPVDEQLHEHDDGRLSIAYGKVTARGAQPGVLVRTGFCQPNHLQYIFNLPDLNEAHWLEVSKDLMESIKAAMREAHTQRDPDPRRTVGPDGIPKSWCPVFFLAEGPDLAERIFGRVPREKKDGTAIAGRVFFESASLSKAEGAEEPLDFLPGEPKVTCYRHYLVQPQGLRPVERRRFNAVPVAATVVRGFKQYWHHPNVARTDLHCAGVVGDSTQHTQCAPLLPGAKFHFVVRFENLRDYELGLLLWCLAPPPPAHGVAHKLGMGRGLGMGSVRITPTLQVDDRAARYARLFDADGGGGWAEPARSECAEFFLKAWDTKLEAHLNGRPNDRAEELLALLEYRLPAGVRKMSAGPARNELRNILPSALHVAAGACNNVLPPPPRQQPRAGGARAGGGRR